jgi:ABC-2 type transport system ATP-binding protein
VSNPVIEVEGLRKRFRTRRGPVEAVAGIDFRVEAGEFVGYAGPNGAGKSTTVKMISGILVPSAGRVEVLGLVPYRERRRLARRMGVVFGQRTQLWWDLPLQESFELVGHLYRVPAADRAARLGRLSEVLALGPLLPVPVRSLSLGQRMRAELAAAVLPAPQVLFLDEPTIGLDVEAKAAVRDFLRELNRTEGTTVILTTHDLDDITRLCSRLMIIDHGRLIYDGTVEALLKAYGTTRVLVVDLAEDEPAEVAGAVLARAEGRRRWYEFARDEVSAAELIARLLAGHEVADLTLEEPDIEDIVRRIYRGEAPRGSGGSSLAPGPDPGGPVLDGRPQGPERLAAVGGGVLGHLVDLGAGPVPAVGQEHRVVAEPAGPPGGVQYPSFPCRLGVPLPSLGVDQDGGAAEPGRAPLRGHPGQGGQELVQVGLVAGALAGVAGRADPGGAAEGVHLEARVVGDRGPARPGGVGPGLDARVLQERVAGLLDLGRVAEAGLGQADQLDGQPGQDRPQLTQLALVGAGQQQDRLHRGTPLGFPGPLLMHRGTPSGFPGPLRAITWRGGRRRGPGTPGPGRGGAAAGWLPAPAAAPGPASGP